MRYSKFILLLPVMVFSTAASAEITFDGPDLSYIGAKQSKLTIGFDGSASVNGALVAKCDGTENNKVIKTKVATVTCDVDYTKVRDKNGNELARYSGYARATDGENEERKLFGDYEPVAKIGSALTGASSYSKSEAIVTETVTEKTIVKTPAAALLEAPKAPDVNEKTYTPKLGTMAEQTPAITKTNSPQEIKADLAIKKAEEEARKYGEERKKLGNEVVVTTSEKKPTEAKETTTIKTTIEPVPGVGVEPKTSVTTTEKIKPIEVTPAK